MNNQSFQFTINNLTKFGPDQLRSGLLGLEREALRVRSTGRLAQSPHPEEFGNKLGGGAITVDFSESQVEFVTQPHAKPEDTLAELENLQEKAETLLLNRDERLWPLSMPPKVCCDEEIPLARFDDSLEGQSRERYREQLARRHGRRRQAISGIHVGISFGQSLFKALAGIRGQAFGRAFSDDAYLGMARNFLRHRWLTVLLSGASPIADESFFSTPPRPDRKGTFSGSPFPHAVSLRQSPHGYADTAENGRAVSFDSLSNYLGDLRSLISSHVLSRENEFYSPLRLKGRLQASETHLEALTRGGVHYAEIRTLDIDPFVRSGIDLATLRFLQLFSVACLLSEAPPLGGAEWLLAGERHHLTALRGSDQSLRIPGAPGENLPLRSAALCLLNSLSSLAKQMDRELPDAPYQIALELMRQRIHHPALLPSSRITAAVTESGGDFFKYGTDLLTAGNKFAHTLAA